MKALADAIRVRRPPVGCIIHSDRGYQFTSAGWLTFARINGHRPSIGERKKPQDNAPDQGNSKLRSWPGSLERPKMSAAPLVSARRRVSSLEIPAGFCTTSIRPMPALRAVSNP
ncbi:hypothetical protein [Herbiconiux sp. 11R-BC]|uniref:hypothetical protein n=1 Tax=Herbiconiux sp. 11R-BC TaxID=3111637 RepID=UPI003C2D9F33